MFRFIPSMFFVFVIISCGGSPSSDSKYDKNVSGNPKLVVEWTGYSNNNIIKLIDVDPTFQQSELMRYAKAEHKQTKKYQNISLFFYNGNAPKTIPIPEMQQTDPGNAKSTGLNGAMEFVKSTKPVITITIIGEGEYEIHQGFSG